MIDIGINLKYYNHPLFFSSNYCTYNQFVCSTLYQICVPFPGIVYFIVDNIINRNCKLKFLSTMFSCTLFPLKYTFLHCCYMIIVFLNLQLPYTFVTCSFTCGTFYRYPLTETNFEVFVENLSVPLFHSRST